MDEFIKMKGKILTIENPILMFSNLLSNTNEVQVKKLYLKHKSFIYL